MLGKAAPPPPPCRSLIALSLSLSLSAQSFPLFSRIVGRDYKFLDHRCSRVQTDGLARPRRRPLPVHPILGAATGAARPWAL